MSTSPRLTIKVRPFLYGDIFTMLTLHQITNLDTESDDSIGIRMPCPGHRRGSSLLAAAAIALDRTLSNMVELLPREYLDCMNSLDRYSGREPHSDHTAL